MLSGGGARSCDVLLGSGDGSRVLEASFGDGVLGHAEARARRFALAVAAEGDVDLEPEIAILRGTGMAPSVLQSSCSDRLGRKLEAATLRVE